jgi:hypothetical protein
MTHFDGPLQRLVLVREPRPIEGVPNGHQDPLRRKRLLDEIEGARLGRLDCGADGPVPGDDDDRQRLVRSPDALQRVEPVHAWHLDIQEHEVRRFPLGYRHAVGTARSLEHFESFMLRIIRTERRISASSSTTRIRDFIGMYYSTVRVTSVRCQRVGS